MFNKALNKITVILILSLIGNSLLSQIKNLGQPLIINHSKSDYEGAPQSWDLDYSNKEFIFLANNNGLLVYDGVDWTNYKTKNKTILRSLALSKNEDKIYVGAQGEFGYFEMVNKVFVYKDLTSLYPQKFEGLSDIWEIENINDTIYFRADNKIFRYAEENLDVYSPGGTITFIKVINGKLIFNKKEKGIFQLENFEEKFIGGGETLIYKELVDAIQLEGQKFIILTRNSGIYFFDGADFTAWENNAQDYIKKNLVNSGYYIKNKELICIGTHLGGLTVFDLEGRLQYVLNSENGLQNNTITSITKDGNSNIWLGTYNGIEEVLLTSSNNRFYPDNGLKGAIYDIELWKEHLYFATSNGLYCIPSKEYYNPLNKWKFQFIPGTEGECWGLDIINNELLVAHNNGGFILNSINTVFKIDLEPGVWKYLSLQDNKMLVGGYRGLFVMQKENDFWKFKYKVQNFEESSRILVLDQENILWVTHPYKGIFKIQTNDEFATSKIDTIGKSEGIDDLNNCYGHELNGQIIISNETNVYNYNYNENKFQIESNLDSIFRSNRLIRIINELDDDYYISDVNAGKLGNQEQGNKTKYSRIPMIPNNETFVGGFENFKVFSKDQILVCTDQGVIISNKNENEGELRIRIKKVLVGDNNSIAFDAFMPDSNDILIPHDQNKIEIHYTSLFSEGVMGELKYSYRLIGATDIWSEWIDETSKKFDFLPPNDYTFEVRSLSNGQQVSSIDKISFTIKPHFLLSLPFKIFYAIIGIICLVMLSLLSKRKLKKEKIQADKKVKVLEAENYDIQLKAKNKELAYSTMHLLQKSELITMLKDDICEVKKHLKDPSAKVELKKIISKLQDDQRVEEDWERFSTHFDKVHHNFFKRLKEQFPNLTSKDLKLCAYLRLNLTTKEIAPLLGISIRGVEISRYRLRKKIELDKNINLNEMMISY